MGSRYEKVPYDGPGTAVYRESNGLFGSVNRPYFYQDPRGKPFIDIDGKECGVRWIYVDPKARHDGSRDDKTDKIGCCIM
ncbi:hypothetical protein Rhopal_000136-T1 [Rhodotorula paludigena]|uniref:Uncharacterized protein n=1 Tax=Rhodotorula paludigena TaxID=86838 RepID=A0AAV5GC16_9BASI|nr:hypothetical protein Rhopal_000136-T1 [Rhodotorula paludigena]